MENMDKEKMEMEAKAAFLKSRGGSNFDGIDVKFFEVRDHATLIGVMAVRVYGHDVTNDQIRWLLKWCGWGIDPLDGAAVFMLRLNDNGGEGYYDSFKWQDRALREAHWAIRCDWDAYKTGDVIDVRVLLGETEVAVDSCRNYGGNDGI